MIVARISEPACDEDVAHHPDVTCSVSVTPQAFAPTDQSMLKTHSRLHQEYRTRSYRKPLKLLERIDGRESFHKPPHVSNEVGKVCTNVYGSRRSHGSCHKFRKLSQAFPSVVEAFISFRGSRGTLTTTEAFTTSMEASTASMVASITSNEASIVSIEAGTGFHGRSPKLPGTLLPHGWRQISWKYSRLPVEVATTSAEASMEAASTEVDHDINLSGRIFHRSSGSFRGSNISFRGSSRSFCGIFHELPLKYQ